LFNDAFNLKYYIVWKRRGNYYFDRNDHSVAYSIIPEFTSSDWRNLWICHDRWALKLPNLEQDC